LHSAAVLQESNYSLQKLDPQYICV